MTVGSTSQLTDLTGIADIIVLSPVLANEYANKIFKPNFIIWKQEEKQLYLTDGSTPLSRLSPITVSVSDILAHFNNTSIHINPSTLSSINDAILTLSMDKLDVSADVNYVHKSGDEVINGNKTFNNAIIGNLTGTADKATSDGNGDSIVNTYLKRTDAANIYTSKSDIEDHIEDTSVHLTESQRQYLNGVTDTVVIDDNSVETFVESMYEE